MFLSVPIPLLVLHHLIHSLSAHIKVRAIINVVNMILFDFNWGKNFNQKFLLDFDFYDKKKSLKLSKIFQNVFTTSHLPFCLEYMAWELALRQHCVKDGLEMCLTKSFMLNEKITKRLKDVRVGNYSLMTFYKVENSIITKLTNYSHE